MRLYRAQRWRRAAKALEGLLTCPGAIGRAARTWCVRAYRALAADAAEKRNYAEAATNLQAAMRVAGPGSGRRSCRRPSFPSGAGARRCLREMERASETKGGATARPRKLAQAQWHAGQREAAVARRAEDQVLSRHQQ